jgi:DUF3102 family protein
MNKYLHLSEKENIFHFHPIILSIKVILMFLQKHPLNRISTMYNILADIKNMLYCPLIMNEQLQSIVTEINSLSSSICDNELLSKKHGKISLRLAIKTGKLLIKSKSIIKKNWKKWFNENIKGFDERTAYNYIRLYNNQMKHVSFGECESLREAYKTIGIIKTKSPCSSIEGKKILTPDEYSQIVKRDREHIRKRIQNVINGADRINWNISEWKIVNGVPHSPDESNFFRVMIDQLNGFLSIRNFHDLKSEDEQSCKAIVLAVELTKKIIMENQETPKRDTTLEVTQLNPVQPPQETITTE